MKVDLYDITGKKEGSIEVADAIFAQEWNADLVHQVMLAMQANQRRPWAHAKGRGEVSGGGKKPWRQKGTGRARHGSIRSPIWKGGGASHGPTKFRNYEQKINKKVLRSAIHAVLSRKLSEGELSFVKEIPTKGKTKEVFTALKGFLAAKRTLPQTLVITATKNQGLVRATRNIANATVISGAGVNVMDLLSARKVVVEEKAISEIK